MKQNYIYAISDEADKVVKIGFSSDPKRRLSQLKTSTVRPLELLLTFKGGCEVERAIHIELKQYRVAGEWFQDCPEVFAVLHRYQENKSENTFDYNTDDLELIKSRALVLENNLNSLAEDWQILKENTLSLQDNYLKNPPTKFIFDEENQKISIARFNPETSSWDLLPVTVSLDEGATLRELKP